MLIAGVGSGLIHKHWTMLERLDRDKRYRLLWKSVNYDRNKFYDTGPWSMSVYQKYQTSHEKNFSGTNAIAHFTGLSMVK
jgi:hypothetical protein